MNERVRELRKTLGLTLEKFGERLGVQKSAVSKWERGENDVPASMVKSICWEWNVSYVWLTQGEGPMFLELDADTEIAKYTTDLLEDTDSITAAMIKSFIITFYQKFDDKSRKICDDILKETLEHYLENRKEK